MLGRDTPVAIWATGLISAVGLDAASTCAALRAKVTNPSATRFMDAHGEPIMAHRVPWSRTSAGRTRLVEMAAAAVAQIVQAAPQAVHERVPLLLCVADQQRLGRLAGLDQQLLRELCMALGRELPALSRTIAAGRAGVAMAMELARELIYEQHAPAVLIVAVDSLISMRTITAYDSAGRLLTSANSDGFIPGEGAGALLVGRPTQHSVLQCVGLGFAHEPAFLDSGEPLRADGLAAAMKAALAGASYAIHDMDYRIADLSGEQYYFKEATLAIARIMRRTKDEFDLWHPAECTGECGAVAGAFVLAAADAACRKGYAPGPRILAHLSNDDGTRAALVLEGAVAT